MSFFDSFPRQPAKKGIAMKSRMTKVLELATGSNVNVKDGSKKQWEIAKAHDSIA